MSSEIFGSLGEQTDIDSDKMNEISIRAKENPTALLEKLDSSQRSKIKSIDEKIETMGIVQNKYSP